MEWLNNSISFAVAASANSMISINKLPSFSWNLEFETYLNPEVPV